MKLLVDFSMVQSQNDIIVSQDRWLYSFIKGMAISRGSNNLGLLANVNYPASFNLLRSEFSPLLPAGSFIPYLLPSLPNLEADSSYEFSSPFIRHACELISPDAILHPYKLTEAKNVGNRIFSKSGFPDSLNVGLIYDFFQQPISDIFHEPSSGSQKLIDQKLNSLKSFDLLWTTSETTRQGILEYLSLDPDQIVYLPPAVDSLFTKNDYELDRIERLFFEFKITRPFILINCEEKPLKRIENVLQILSGLPSDILTGHDFLFINTGPASNFANLTHSFGEAKNNFIFSGNVSDENYAILLNLCRLVLFPSPAEGSNIHILEAMACGAPVIAPETGTVLEVLGRGESLFDSGHEISMLEIIVRILNNANFRDDLHNYGLEKVKSFSWENSAQKAWDSLHHAAIKKEPGSNFQLVAPSLKPRLAFVTTISPANFHKNLSFSGLLPFLEKYFDIDIFLDGGSGFGSFDLGSSNEYFSWTELQNRRDQYVTALYLLENSEKYLKFIALLREFPGLVVLSPDLQSLNYPDGGLRSELSDRPGLRASLERIQKGRELEISEWPVVRNLARYAHEIVVDNNYQRELVNYLIGNDWDSRLAVIRRPLSDRGDAHILKQEEIRKQLGFEKDSFILCSFGLINPEKYSQILAQAFLDSFRDHKEVFLIFVGFAEKEYELDFSKTIKTLNMGDRIKVTGLIDVDNYYRYLSIADVAVQLEQESNSDKPGLAFDALSFGIPTITNAQKSRQDFPPGSVITLSQFPDAAELSSALVRLYQDVNLRKNIRHSLRQEIDRTASLELVALEYARLVSKAARKDERLIFDPLIEFAIRNNLSAQTLAAAASVAATNLNIRSPIRLLIDVSIISGTDLRTGIETVVKNLIRELFAVTRPSFQIEPVHIKNNKLLHAHRFSEYLFDLPKNSLGEEHQVKLKFRDYLYMLDSPWGVYAQYAPIFTQIQNNGGRIFTQVYDLLPIRHPRFFQPELRKKFLDWFLNTVQTSDGLICISKSVADDVIDYIRENNFQLTHPLDLCFAHLGSDSSSSNSLEGQIRAQVHELIKYKSENLFLMVGSLDLRKGHGFVLDAFEQLWRDGVDVKLCIIGRVGWNVESLVERIRTHSELGNRLFFIESGTDAEVNLCYANSIALISASVDEGFGLPLIEAAHHNIPSIVSDIPVFHEVGGEGAIYFSLQSPSFLTSAVKSFIKLTPQERLSLVKKINILSWTESAGKIRDLLQNKLVYKTLRSPQPYHDVAAHGIFSSGLSAPLPLNKNENLHPENDQEMNMSPIESNETIYIDAGDRFISLEDVMERIRDEVALRKAEALPADIANGPRLVQQETGLFKVIKQIQFLFQKLPFYQPVYRFALMFKFLIPKYREPGIPVSGFLQLDNEEFVNVAYKTILKREPDPASFDFFLSKLNNGLWTRHDVLAKLRYSPEGMRAGVNIIGLSFFHFIASLLHRN